MMAQGTTIKDMKKVDEVSKLIVFGYMRTVESLFPGNECYFLTPLLATYWCLLYYADREFFQSPIGSKIKLNDTNDIAKVSVHNTWHFGQVIYGNIGIKETDNFIYIWEIKILHPPRNPQCVYSLMMNKYNVGQQLKFGISDGGQFEGNYYIYSNDGCSGSHKQPISRYGVSFKEGDIIRMELNVQLRTLIFYTNDECQGIAYNDIDFDDKNEYRMTIEIPAKHIAVQCIKFDRIRIH